MSSILDALERAERERQNHSLKAAGKESQPTAHPTRRRLWLMAGLVLLLNLILWLLWWHADVFDGAQPDLPPAQPPVDRPAAVPSPPGPHPPAPNQVSQGLPSLQVPTEWPARAPVRPLMEEALVKGTPELATRPVPPPLPRVRAPAPTPVTTPTAPATSKAPPVRLPAKPVPAVPSTPPVQVEAQPAPAKAAPSIWGLPDALRRKLEGLRPSVHVYSERPTERFVVIRMHRYREGDRLGDSGFKLKRITRKGIVIDYGDGEVRL